MKNRNLFIIFFLLLFVCQGKSQITEKDLIRDAKTSCLYFTRNGQKSLVNEKVITVKMKPESNALDVGFKVIRSNILGYADIEVPADVKVEDFVVKLKKSKVFEGVYYNTFGEMDMHPNDIEFDYQEEGYYQFINMQDAWDYSTGSSSVKVAVLDSKVAYNHPDLGIGPNGNLLLPSGWTYGSASNPHHHGTKVTGIIGAKTNNGIGISGIAGGNNSHGATVIPYCVTSTGIDGDEHPDLSVVDDAILAAVSSGVKVINMSFGNFLAREGDYPSVDAAIEYAYNQGTVLVAASGNIQYNITNVKYPANHPKVIAVGSGFVSSGRSSFSCYGDEIEIVAPGVLNKSTTVTTEGVYTYEVDWGTSFSAPIVSGVVALLLSIKPNLTPNEIRSILHKTASKHIGYSYNSNGWCDQIGYGVINARAALSLVSLSISGPKVASSPAVYGVENLSQDYTVFWLLSDSYYNQNCLEQNTPSANQCTITPDYYQDMTNESLTAIILKGGMTIKSVTKSGIYAQDGFKGHYTSGNLSGDINYTHYFNVKTNTATTVTSPNFYDAMVSYSSSGVTPTAWGYNPTTGVLNFKTSISNAAVVINVTDCCGNSYVLYAYGTSQYKLNVSNGDSGITVSLDEGDDSERGISLDQSWTVEVRNVTTGALMATLSSTSRSEIISTVGWPKGIYVVKATIGDEELTEKVIVK